MILSEKGSTYKDLLYCTRDENGSYALIYLPQNRPVRIDLEKISGNVKNIWWYDPRTGKVTKGNSIKGKSEETFTPPENGQDWVLVIDDASQKFSKPGTN
jgi:hypothetical protein